jgi:hypothetical protein
MEVVFDNTLSELIQTRSCDQCYRRKIRVSQSISLALSLFN